MKCIYIFFLTCSTGMWELLPLPYIEGVGRSERLPACIITSNIKCLIYQAEPGYECECGTCNTVLHSPTQAAFMLPGNPADHEFRSTGGFYKLCFTVPNKQPSQSLFMLLPPWSSPPKNLLRTCYVALIKLKEFISIYLLEKRNKMSHTVCPMKSTSRR